MNQNSGGNSQSPPTSISNMKFLFCILALVAAVSAQSDIDWCAVKTQYCGTKPHIACNPNDFTVSGLSSNVKMLELTQKMKDSILAAHNNYRNQVAGGEFNSTYGFPAAAKMTEMKWDDTLQYVAEVHAAYGEMSHDKCRATPAFRYSGQNLYQSMSSANTLVGAAESVINKGVVAWFDEIEIADPALVDKLLSSHMAAGHFSVMVNDLNNFVGCGASTFDYLYNGRNWYGLLLTCNYQYTNMLNTPTYVRGTPCSSCNCSATYPNLCAAA